jgi:hypothetical protein
MDDPAWRHLPRAPSILPVCGKKSHLQPMGKYIQSHERKFFDGRQADLTATSSDPAY